MTKLPRALVPLLLAAALSACGADSAGPQAAISSLGKEFRHPTGFGFKYSDEWQVREQGGKVQLIAPGGDAASEFIVIGGEPAGGATDPGADQVGRLLDAEMRRMAPFLSRTGAPARFERDGVSGAVYTYAGTSPKVGAFEARIWTWFASGNAYLLMAGAPAERMETLRPRLDQVFATFSVRTPSVAQRPSGERDPAMAGQWTYSEIHAGGAGTYRETYVLQADGQLLRKTTVNMSLPNANAYNRGQFQPVGTWRTEGRHLHLTYPDGSTESFRYYVEVIPRS